MRALKTISVCLALLLGMEREARAYTDPGTGALLWQILVAGLVGCLFYIRRITSWFKTNSWFKTKEKGTKD